MHVYLFTFQKFLFLPRCVMSIICICLCFVFFFYVLAIVISSLLFRQNHHGTISGRQLGEAAQRLVVNSLQAKGDYNVHGNQMHVSHFYAGHPRYPPPASYTNNRGYYDHEYQRGAPPRTVHPPQGQHDRSSNYDTIPSHNNRGGYNDHHTSSAARHHHYNNNNNNRSHSQHYGGRNNRYPSHGSGERPNHVQYPQSGIHQDAGPPGYSHGHSQSHRPTAQIPPAGVGYHPYQGGGYNHYQNYQPSGASGHQWRGGGSSWVPQSSQTSVTRGYGRPQQQSGNHYSALDRRSNRPPPGYGR